MGGQPSRLQTQTFTDEITVAINRINQIHQDGQYKTDPNAILAYLEQLDNAATALKSVIHNNSFSKQIPLLYLQDHPSTFPDFNSLRKVGVHIKEADITSLEDGMRVYDALYTEISNYSRHPCYSMVYFILPG
jgi:hypothetical protein